MRFKPSAMALYVICGAMVLFILATCRGVFPTLDKLGDPGVPVIVEPGGTASTEPRTTGTEGTQGSRGPGEEGRDAVEVTYARADLDGDGRQELIAGASLSLDEGYVAVYKVTEGRGGNAAHTLVARADTSPVSSVWVEGGRFIFAAEEYDESVGAFMKVRSAAGFVLEGKSLKRVFEAPLDVDSSWNVGWTDGKGDRWERVTQSGRIRFTSEEGLGPALVVDAEQAWERFVESDGEYRPERTRTVQMVYRWDPRWARFLRGTAEVKRPGAAVRVQPGPVQGGEVVAPGTVLGVLEVGAETPDALAEWPGGGGGTGAGHGSDVGSDYGTPGDWLRVITAAGRAGFIRASEVTLSLHALPGSATSGK